MKYIIPFLFFYSAALGQQLPTGPVQFVRDTKTVNVKQDTVTPANSVGLPVNIVAGTVNATNPSVSSTGAAVPSSATFIGANKSGNLVAPTLDGSDNLNVNVQVSALPSGAATEAKQDTGNTSLGSIDTFVGSIDANTISIDTTTQSIDGTVTNIDNKIPANLTVTSNRLEVDGSGVTQPVSGTVAVSNPGLTDAELRASAVPVSVASIPLASGAATEAKQDTQITSLGTINTTLGSPFQAGASIGNTSFGISGTLPAFASTPTVDIGTIAGIATETTLSALNTKVPSNLTVTSTRLLVDGSGVTQPVSASSLPLPTGAATEAKQDTQITSLSTIATNSGKTPINTTGSGTTGTVSTVITLTAPANAVGFILTCLDTSTENIRWAIGRTATTTVGAQLQPGRDTGYVPFGDDVSIVSESGTQGYDIAWVSQ